MANWETLKQAIANSVKANNNQEITGQLLQNILTSIIDNVGEKAAFAGVAYPETNPGTPDGPVFYLTTQAGTYPNFGNVVVQKGNMVILLWSNNTWSTQTLGIPTYEYLEELFSESTESSHILPLMPFSEINNVTDELLSYMRGLKPLKYAVTRVYQNNSYVVGQLDMFSDSLMHQLTQIYTTHEVLSSTGNFDGTHKDDEVYMYYRSFSIQQGGKWTAWQKVGHELEELVAALINTVSNIESQYVKDFNITRPYIAVSLLNQNFGAVTRGQEITLGDIYVYEDIQYNQISLGETKFPVWAWGNFGLSPNSGNFVNISAGTRRLLFSSVGFLTDSLADNNPNLAFLQSSSITITYEKAAGQIDLYGNTSGLSLTRRDEGDLIETVVVRVTTELLSAPIQLSIPRGCNITRMLVLATYRAKYRNITSTVKDAEGVHTVQDQLPDIPSFEIPENILTYDVQSLTQAQQQQAAKNLGYYDGNSRIINGASIISGSLKFDSFQNSFREHLWRYNYAREISGVAAQASNAMGIPSFYIPLNRLCTINIHRQRATPDGGFKFSNGIIQVAVYENEGTNNLQVWWNEISTEGDFQVGQMSESPEGITTGNFYQQSFVNDSAGVVRVNCIYINIKFNYINPAGIDEYKNGSYYRILITAN